MIGKSTATISCSDVMNQYGPGEARQAFGSPVGCVKGGRLDPQWNRYESPDEGGIDHFRKSEVHSRRLAAAELREVGHDHGAGFKPGAHREQHWTYEPHLVLPWRDKECHCKQCDCKDEKRATAKKVLAPSSGATALFSRESCSDSCFIIRFDYSTLVDGFRRKSDDILSINNFRIRKLTFPFPYPVASPTPSRCCHA